MEQILYKYELNLTTWVYLSSLLLISIYFKFNRLWSVRNLDLLGLIALAPGLLLVEQTGDLEYWGYFWLFVASGLFMARLLMDPMMVRRPLLEPNMSTGGLTFLGVCLLLFLMVNVLTKNPSEADFTGARQLDQLLARQEAPENQTNLSRYGPGFPLLHWLPSLTTKALLETDLGESTDTEEIRRQQRQIATARTTAILAQLATVIAIVLIGVRHFDNIRTGLAVATLYLLLPYTATMSGRAEHAIPAALLVWAVLTYRLPMVAGIFIGLAIAVVYYPLFLLPLWIGFYWQRGLPRFLIGVGLTLGLATASLALISSNLENFLTLVGRMFGFTMSVDGIEGFWAFGDVAIYRTPVQVAFIVLSFSMMLWPAQKNLGTLMSCSAAIMLGTQFWHPHGGGVYMGWYLPLLLLTIFRPNLEDRVAISTLLDGWLMRRRWNSRRRAA